MDRRTPSQAPSVDDRGAERVSAEAKEHDPINVPLERQKFDFVWTVSASLACGRIVRRYSVP
jgi:hypothetical protein